MSFNILVVGLGALGKRHLSSILNSELELNVYGYDINPDALVGFQWENIYHNKSLKMISSFNEIENIDFALFAMTSVGRRDVFDKLVEQVKVKNILFEKVLFQRIEDYTHVQAELKRLGIKAWVNCARRQMDSYQSLRERLLPAKEMRISISGGEWGLACNSIHEIDLVEFLAGSDSTQVTSLELLPLIAESKRPGFKEIYGTVKGCSGKCKDFSINCMKDTDVQDILTINTDIGQFIVLESNRKLLSMTRDNDYELKVESFEIPYQSQMTQFVFEDILLKGSSRLADFDTSARLHLQFIEPLIKFFNDNGWEEKSCPIT
jgi:hypothetical protein